MMRFALPADDGDLLLFLDRFRFAILEWADVLGVAPEECRALVLDYDRLNQMLTPFRQSLVELSELYGVSARETSIRGLLPDIRSRLSWLIARIESHPAYTVRIATELRIVPEANRSDLVLSAGESSDRPLSVGKLPAYIRN
jgi:hypothetical protein